MKIKCLFMLIAILIFQPGYSFANNAIASPDKGKTIFTTQCASCHSINAQIVGPALANVDERHSIDWIVSFIHSPQTLIQKNDKEAVALYNQFNQILMPNHSNLSSDDIKNILGYIKSQTKTTSATVIPFVKPWKVSPNYQPLSISKDMWFFILYIVAVVVLFGLLLFATEMKDLERGNELFNGKKL